MKALFVCLLLLTTFLTHDATSESLPLIGGMPGALEQSVTVGDLAYCATSSGLLVLDVADPAAISQVSWTPLPQGVWWAPAGVAVVGDRACLAVWDLGLVVIDIGDPAAPTVLGICDAPTRPGGVAASGDHAFVADMGLGFCVIDIGDPTAPFLATTALSGEEYRAFAFVDDMAYLGSDLGSFYLVDVTDPLVPSLAGSHDFPGYVRGIEVTADGLAYLACGSLGLRVIDVTEPGALVETGHLVLEFGSSWGCFATEVSVTADVAYVALSSRGLGLVDVSDPTAPAELVVHEVAGDIRGLEGCGERLHVAAHNGGLAVLDVSVPGAPVDLGQHWLVGMALDVAARDGRLWVAGGWADTDEKSTRTEAYAGLFVVEDEQVIGYGSTGLLPQAITLSGDLAFLPADFGGVRIQGIADPAAPMALAMIDTPVEHCAPAAAGGFAYVHGYDGLMVYDVSDPENPVLVGAHDTSHFGNLLVRGDHVYSVSSYLGLMIYDVGDPTAPLAIGSVSLPSSAREGALLGDHLCVANGPHGLSVVDVSDPTQPVVVGSCAIPGLTMGVACRWPYAYVVASDFIDAWGGLHVVDVTDPTAPVVVIANEIRGQPVAVALDGPHVAVAAHWGGVMVFRHDATTSMPAPRAARSLRNHPNPFNPQTSIRFHLPQAAHASLAVYDVAGRRVRSLLDGSRAAGPGAVGWDGRDDRGRAVGAGVYLCRLVAGEHRETCRLVLVR
jgi:hypothetical protein